MRKFSIAIASMIMSATVAGAQTTEGAQMPMSEDMSNMPGMDAAMQMPPVTAEMIGESGMRRLVFYANRAVAALEKVLDISDSADTLEQSKINNQFRSAAARLLDAGTRSELEFEQVAFFFMAAVIDRFGEGFMQRIGQAGGGVDMLTLFRNVSVVSDSGAAGVDDQGAEFLNSLAATTEADPENVSTEANPENIVRTPEEDIRPVAFPNANRAELSIIDRILIIDANWEITVVRGDTLSLFSSAVYGDARSYNLIFQANKDRLRNPNIIGIGQKIHLPRP